MLSAMSHIISHIFFALVFTWMVNMLNFSVEAEVNLDDVRLYWYRITKPHWASGIPMRQLLKWKLWDFLVHLIFNKPVQ